MISTIKSNQNYLHHNKKPKKTAFIPMYTSSSTSNFNSNLADIQKLNPDCLLEIFSHLEFLQKVKIECVCRQWFYVLQSCQAYADADTLDISKFLCSTNSEYYQQDNLNFEPLVKGVVKRGGPYVRQITFGKRWFKISQGIIDQISQHCQQLRKIDFSCTIINGSLIPILDKVSNRLTDFSLEESTWVNDGYSNQIQYYIEKKFKKIKNLNLRKQMFNLNVIVNLPLTLQSIDISGTKYLSGNSLAQFFDKHTELIEFIMNPIPHTLKMSYVHLLNYEQDPINGELQIAINQISKLKKLKTLEIGYIPHDQYSLNLQPLSSLINLTNLHIEACDCLTFNVLQQILTETKNIEQLTLIDCNKIADYSPIGNLKKLNYLHIEKSIQICYQDIELIAQNQKVKTLKLRKCFNVTNKAVKTIIDNCPLNELDLSMCENIDDGVIDALVDTSNDKCNIEILGLNSCINITGNGIKKLASSSKIITNLKSLDVTKNKYVDNNSILALHNALLKISNKKILTCYISHSGTSNDIEKQVQQTINIIF